MSIDFLALFAEWAAIRERTAEDTGPFLRRIREMGRYAVDPGERFRLQDLARDIASHIFRTTDEYPVAVIEAPAPAPQAHRLIVADISRIVGYAPAHLIGREAEMQILTDAWERARRDDVGRPQVITFVGLGGQGKTSLVARWAVDLAGQGWPGCDAVYAWSFYSQGAREQPAASSDLFFRDALTVFGDVSTAISPQPAFEKGRRLAQLVAERRTLLILDGVEPLQHPPGSLMDGRIKDVGLSTFLKGLATNSRGLCVITTAYSIGDLRAYSLTTAPEYVLHGLSTAASVDLLRSLGVKGTMQECMQLVDDVGGHPLTISLIGAFLRDAYGGDIRKRDRLTLAQADGEERGGHGFRVIDAYVRWLESEGDRGQLSIPILRMLGLFDRPANADLLSALQQPPAIPGLTDFVVLATSAQRSVAISRLEAARLVSVARDAAGSLVSLDAHPLIREYFSYEMRTRLADSWREAHRRLFDHLITTTPEKAEPTLEDLQPLYMAVAHGCRAGMVMEALAIYRERILKGRQMYSVSRLGAFSATLGAIACFFDEPWTHVSPAVEDSDRRWLLAQAAWILRALGRFVESREPMRAAFKMAIGHGDWKAAAIGASTLSEIALTLGDIPAAVADAEEAIRLGDRSGDGREQMARTVLAHSLFVAGRTAEARAHFSEAEMLQAVNHPEHSVLYSLSGFRFCELLLAGAERTAWRCSTTDFVPPADEYAAGIAACRAVSTRAQRLLELGREMHWLLDIALGHLLLGRALLFEGVLQRAVLDDCRTALTDAVDHFRRAGHVDYLPSALLSRSWCSVASARAFEREGLQFEIRSCTDHAQRDLDEAWEIAERGPMPLVMADIHLHRSRLFFREVDYPWGGPGGPKDDLTKARRLIEKHGYWRRKGELEDAEAVVGRLT